MIKAVLFDMDGVLAFTEGFYRRRKLAYLAANGFSFDSGRDWAGQHDDEIWRKIVPDDERRRDQLRRGYERYTSESPTPWAELVNRDAHDVIARLRAGGRMVAVCSSSPRDLVDECLRQLGVGGQVLCSICGDECASHKPDPGIYLEVMGALGVSPSEALVVEDSPIGIEAGKRSGAFVCALRQPSGEQRLDQHSAGLVLSNLCDLFDLIG